VYNFKRGHSDEALRLIRRALEVKPDYALAHGHYGRLLLQRGQVREALVHLKRSLELEPDQQGYEELKYQIRILEERLGTHASPSPTTQAESEGN
jgi:tetratricopeptide (TPR) repeat protein